MSQFTEISVICECHCLPDCMSNSNKLYFWIVYKYIIYKWEKVKLQLTIKQWMCDKELLEF